MKRIKMNVCLAGAEFVFNPGEEYDVADELADALCSDDRAALVEQPATAASPKRRRARSTAASNAETAAVGGDSKETR